MQEKFSSGRHRIFKNRHGNIDTVHVGEKIILETSVGNLVPRYTLDEESRKKEAPVKFYKTGQLKSVPLEEPTDIATPAGTIKAELITFYRSGALCRIFPLDGKISGYWTEENEYNLAETLDIPTPVGTISIKPIYLQFYESGELESILFWPKEQVGIATSVGHVHIRKGISFYLNGNIKGFEPVRELRVESPIGYMNVFDPDPNGLQAENYALNFYENGAVQSITTASSQVEEIHKGGEPTRFSPKVIPSYCDESEFFVSPLKILFENDSITFVNAGEPAVTVSDVSQFEISDFIPKQPIAGISCK